jgi:hypothetical protein
VKVDQLPPINEKTFQDRHVIPLAKMLGWEVYHPHLSKWSERGWPDLAMVRAGRLVFAELKSDAGVLTADQTRWIGLLDGVAGVEVYVWRPAQLQEIADILR